MSKHCGWCGRFVATDTEPTCGTNIHGKPLSQLLCPECRPVPLGERWPNYEYDDGTAAVLVTLTGAEND